MINFSKVAQQLVEQPVPFDPSAEGGMGRLAEPQGVKLLKHLKPNSQFDHLGGNDVKTDALETNQNDDKVGYSLKATKNPNIPVGVNKSNGQVGNRGSYRKLMMPGSDRDEFFNQENSYQGLSGDAARPFLEQIKDSKAAQAYMMMFGANIRGNQNRRLQLSDLTDYFPNLDERQTEYLRKISRNRNDPFASVSALKKGFEGHYEELLGHLNDNKFPIFDKMVRQHEGTDDNPIERMMHIRSRAPYNRIFSDASSNRMPTRVDIRDMSEDNIKNKIEKLHWYGDENRNSLYMAPRETDDWNERLLNIHPMNANTDSWGATPGRLGGRQGFAKPGALQTLMGINENMLQDVFGNPLYSANVSSTARVDRNTGQADPNSEEIDFDSIEELYRGGNQVLENNLNNFTNTEYSIMNFSKLHLSEGESLDAAAASAEKAKIGSEKQRDITKDSRQKQKSQMATQTGLVRTSDVSYTSEEARMKREYDKMIANESVDWRKELYEAATPDEQGNHPFVDVMPFMDQKQQEAKKQMKGAVKDGRGMQSSMQQAPDMAEGLSVKDQMKVSQDYFKKRNARSPEEKAAEEKKDAAGRAKNAAANRNNNIGQFDHSKRND
jgi:hypothetical protein